MNIALDFGNTQTKLGLFQQGNLEKVLVFQEDHQLSITIAELNPSKIIVSNVGQSRLTFVKELEKNYPVVIFSHQSHIPIINCYDTPKTLGMDRLAAVIGAQVLFPNQASLVIDLGTCITYDFITKDKKYLGGGISPGMRLRNKAMHDYTANLPLLEQFSSTHLIGTNTRNSLLSGIVNGISFEIEGLIRAYQEGFGIFNTVMCGGDAIFFDSNIKASIFVRQEIVLIGLNEVLRQNTPLSSHKSRTQS